MNPRSFLLSLAAAGLLAACGAQGVGNNGAANEAVPAEVKADPAIAVTPAWLAGRWQSEGGCAPGDPFLAFESGGRYAFMAEEGRWSLEGARLTVEITRAMPDGEAKAGDRTTREVRAIGADEAEFQRAGQPPIRVQRCR